MLRQSANQYNQQTSLVFPYACALAFPAVMIDGDLFEAQYDQRADKLTLEPTHHSPATCGSDHSPF